MADETRDWVVRYKARQRTPAVVWLVIPGVPRELEEDQVAAALEVWQRWPQWRERVGLQGSILLRPATRRDELNGATVLAWAELAPATRAIQVQAPGELHAAIRRAAALEGVSMNAWVIAALEAAVAAGTEV